MHHKLYSSTLVFFFIMNICHDLVSLVLVCFSHNMTIGKHAEMPTCNLKKMVTTNVCKEYVSNWRIVLSTWPVNIKTDLSRKEVLVLEDT